MPGDMPTATNGRKVSRPAQGKNSLPVPAARPRYGQDPTGPTLRRASIGKVSKPSPGPGPRYSVQPAPRRVRD
jgi:hypothetical protein